jgi:hypothetical protein
MLRGGAGVNRRQCRAPGRWWWIKVGCSVLLLAWRTALYLLTWWHH